jgi:hypothetical protein
LLRAKKSSSSALSCGVFCGSPTRFRRRCERRYCGDDDLGKICFQKSAIWRSTMTIGTRPALSISRQSSSAKASGASLRTTRGLPSAANRLLSAHEALVVARDLAHEDLLAGKVFHASDFVEMQGPSPQSRSRRSVRRSKIDQLPPLRRDRDIGAAMSPLPAASAGRIWSPRTGMNTTRTLKFFNMR